MSSDIDKIKSEYGKALLTGEYIPQDTDSALKILEKAVKLKNINAKRFLALEYISGEHLEQDIEKGIALLTECADSGDVIASYRLGKIYLQGEIMSQNLDKAERYLLLAEDNEYTQYALAKLYLQEEKYDIQKAVNFFENCAAKNHWASYQLGRIYLFGVAGLTKDKEKLSNGLQSLQMMAMNMHRLCWTTYQSLRMICLRIRFLVCLLVLVGV